MSALTKPEIKISQTKFSYGGIYFRMDLSSLGV